MVAITEEKEMNNKEEIEYKIEIATQTLDRNIGFVTNCDNKTSIILALVGVLITVILTNEGLNEILYIVKNSIESKKICNVLYLICFIGTILVMAFGILNLGSVLVAKTSEEAIGRKDASSRIFFMGIRKSGDYKDYNYKFHAMNKEVLLDELIEQIYINADIAFIKYKKYNRGLRCTSVGFVFFLVFLFIGTYIY